MLDIQHGVAVITLDNPPVNSLGHGLRARLAQQLADAQEHPDVRAIVLTGSDKAFSAGADIREFGTLRQLQEPVLPQILADIDASGKPVVAAIAGLALGGGLELALACHARIARANARVGLPEITLGLIPGAGGTQRLPRLVGIKAAYALMSGAAPQTARALQHTGLFDVVVEDDAPDALITAAIGHALVLAEHAMSDRHDPTRPLDATTVHAEVEQLRAQLTAHQARQPAWPALLDALAACALPLQQGLQQERALFLSLVPTPAAQALRYQFQAERDARKLPVLEQTRTQATPRPLHTVAVIGVGTMGAGIAMALLNAGFPVLLLEQDDAALARGQARIAAYYQKRVAAGKLTADAACAIQARLTATLDWPRLREADLIIEAVFEDLAVKQTVFRQLDTHARPGAVLATNTSYLDVDAIAAATGRPHDVLGLHFFSPAQVMKLLEVVRGAHTTPDVLATGMALGAALNKTPVLAGNAFGFIGNRIYNAWRRQCEFMLEDGAWPEEVDAALTDFGFAMGPFAVADLSGLDIAWRMRQTQAAARDPRERYVDILDKLCEQGRLGRKTGAGYYVYSDGKQTPTTDASVRALIEAASARRGITRQPIAPEVICRRALLAMVNEAALLLAEGVAARPGDVDVVMVHGYGFPRWQGGPVFWARKQDRVRLETDLQQLGVASGHGFVMGDLRALVAD